MDRKFVIGDRSYDVEMPSEPGKSFRGEMTAWVSVNGARRAVEVLDSGAHHVDLIVDGRRSVLYVAADTATDGVWVSAGGRARLISVEPEERGRRQRRGGDDRSKRKVTPSFPATVVKVMVEVGEEVARGQPLVVVSAMKMEMTLRAPHGGVVRAVNAVQGASVGPGDELVIVEPGGDEGGEGPSDE